MKCIKHKLKNIRMTIKQRTNNILYALKIILKASKRYFWGELFFSLIGVVLPFISMFIWRDLLNRLVSVDNVKNELLNKIIVLAIVYLISLFLSLCLESLQKLILYKYNDEIDYYIDNILIDYILNEEISFFDSSDSKDKLNHVTSIMPSIIKNIPSVIFDIMESLVWFIVAIIMLGEISVLFVILIVCISIPSIVINRIIEKKNYSFNKSNSKIQRKISYYQGLFNGNALLEIKIYNLVNEFSQIYENLFNRYRKQSVKHSTLIGVIQLITVVVSIIGDVIIYSLTISKFLSNTILIGDFALYISLLESFKSRFSMLIINFNSLVEISDEIGDVRELLENSNYKLERTGKLTLTSNPKIEFKNVSFKYPNSNKYVLKNCSFVIDTMEKVAIIGLNGGGKSTIIKLICRFYDPQEGEILINGVSNKEYNIHSLRNSFTVSFQDYTKYSLTLKENIIISNLQEAHNHNKIQLAYKNSQINEFADSWEHGLDENLTKQFDSNGKELSGGEWQRVALARTFFRDSFIVILDEPSASVDAITEEKIFNQFYNDLQEKGLILVSHRLSSVYMCDKIIVLQNGMASEVGSHQELLKKDGEYSRLFKLQANKYNFRGKK